MSHAYDEKDPVAMPKVDELSEESRVVEERLTEAERRVKRLESRVEVLERGAQ